MILQGLLEHFSLTSNLATTVLHPSPPVTGNKLFKHKLVYDADLDTDSLVYRNKLHSKKENAFPHLFLQDIIEP